MTNTGERFQATLCTRGRKTGKEHTVTLKAVKYNGKLYFSRHRPDADWFKNALVNSEVMIKYNGTSHAGIAKEITDENLRDKISQMKYPSEKRSLEKRVTIEVTLYE